MEVEHIRITWPLLELPSLELSKVQTYPQIYFLNAIFDYYLTFYVWFIFDKILSKQGVNPKRYSWFLFFHILFLNYASYFLSHFIVFCSSSIYGRCWADWIKVVIKKNWRGIFTITTLHDIVVLHIFCILQVDFVPICLQVQSFYSQQNKYMDVHEF